MFKTTNRHAKYWQNRQIDWRQSYFTPEHPHRELIIQALRKMKLATVYELGCGAGANLHKIVKAMPYVRVGGVDISESAIEEARKHLPPNAILEARSAHDVFMNDKSVDVLVTDMLLIYYGPRRIHAAFDEITRITRSQVVFVEFYASSWWKRLKLWSRTGYFAHDYPKLLQKHGFYDIELYKLTETDWPGGQPQKDYAYLITAKL